MNLIENIPFSSRTYSLLKCTDNILQDTSYQFSRSVMSYSLRPHGLQHTRPPCPSPTPRVYSNSWSIESVMPSNHLILCHPLLLLPSICPSIRVFTNEQLFASGDQSIGVSASASVLPMNIQDWFPLGWPGLISLQSKGLSYNSKASILRCSAFFYSPTLTPILHMLGHKTSLNKFKTEVILSIFSEHDMKLVINKKAGKFTNMWKLNNILLNQWVQKKRQTQIETQQNVAKAIWEVYSNKHQH